MKNTKEKRTILIPEHELPDDLKENLTEQRQIDTSYGKFILPAWYEAPVVSVVINHHATLETFDPPPIRGNPYDIIDGLFSTTACSLILSSPQSTDPDGILLWLPVLQCYGTWNNDGDQQLYVFPDVTWMDIERDLPRYLLTRWNDHTFPDVRCYVKIWEYFDFIPDDYLSRVKSILALPDGRKQKKAEEFISLNEYKLLTHPLNASLNHAYEALLFLYTELAHSASDTAEAIAWLEQSLPLIDQYEYFAGSPFADIFLQLSQYYLETCMFDMAHYSIDKYQQFKPSAAPICDEMRDMIYRAIMGLD